MRERSALLVGIAILVMVVATISAIAVGPSSNKIESVTPDVGNNPGIAGRDPGLTATGPAARSSRTTIAGGGPTIPAATNTPAPFTLAAPEGSVASTTIPGPAPTFYRPTTTTTSTTTTIPPPPSPATTTPQQTEPFIPPTASISEICGFTLSVRSLFAITVSDRFDNQALTNRLAANLARYQQVAPADATGSIALFRTDFDRVLTALAANNWKSSSAEIQSLVSAIGSRSEPFPAMLDNLNSVSRVEVRQCQR